MTITLELEPNKAKGILRIVREDKRDVTFPLLYYGDPEIHGEKAGNVYLDKSSLSRETKPRIKNLDQNYRTLPVHYLDVRLDTGWERRVIHNENRINDILNEEEKRRIESRLRFSPSGFFLTDEEKKELEMLLSMNEEIRNDTRKWRYQLNIRGLILYILGEIELEKGEKKIGNIIREYPKWCNIYMNMGQGNKASSSLDFTMVLESYIKK